MGKGDGSLLWIAKNANAEISPAGTRRHSLSSRKINRTLLILPLTNRSARTAYDALLQLEINPELLVSR
jgi:hypothetical protein